MALCRKATWRYSRPLYPYSIPWLFIKAPRSCAPRASPWPLTSRATGLQFATLARPPSGPRSFPTQGFDIIDAEQLVEEERQSVYRSDHYYPVNLGEVFDDRYQVVAKLGYGSGSTVWLAKELQKHQYVTLKVYIHNSARNHELPFYKHLDTVLPSEHTGADNVRKLLESFEVVGPYGTHIVLVHQAAQLSLHDMDTLFMKGGGFDEDLVKQVTRELLNALDFLHTSVQAVHTDVHAGNLLVGLNDNSSFKRMEDHEFTHPVPRKKLCDRTIYCSRAMTPRDGPLLLSDFGAARLGPGPHDDDISPMPYRSPEALLWLSWSYPVDIWSAGLTAWTLLEGKHLFNARKEDGSISDGAHLAGIIAALGPPPTELLARTSGRALEYWDENYQWANSDPIPTERTLEASETKLEDNTKFLAFIRRALTWEPCERPTAKDLLQDPWLTGLT